MRLNRWITKSQKVALLGAATFFFGVAMIVTAPNKAASAGDCSDNAIVTCGASSASDLIAKIKADKGGDLAAIYAAYGLPAGEYERFASSAKRGVVYKDSGEVKVDGQTVGVASKSIGRVSKSYSQPVNIDGKTYHESKSTDVMQSDADVMVLFDANGNAQAIVINDCGNPVKVTPVNASCENLTIAATSDKLKYTLTVSAATTPAGSVPIQGYNFVVKDADGKTVDSKASTATAATDSYVTTVPGPGTYSVEASVRTAHGTKVSTACTGKIVVETPPPTPTPTAECKQLNAVASATDRLRYTLTATATTAEGATIKGYTYTVKNAAGAVVDTKTVTTTAATTTQEIVLPDYGTYTAAVSVDTSLGAKTAETCITTITAKAPDQPKTPNVSIVKTVDSVKSKEVAVGQTFTYQLTVKNTGDVVLKHVIVADKAPTGVTLLNADKGTIQNNTWTHQLPELQIGDSVIVLITAKVPDYRSGQLVNTACVNAPEVNPSQPNNDDACDNATVTVPAPVQPAPTPPPAPTLVVPQKTEVLPNTGAGSVIGVFVAVTGASMVAYQMVLGRKLGA